MTRRDHGPVLAGLCPACGRPLAYGEELVATRIGDRVVELHRDCLVDVEAGPAERLSGSVGKRLKVIFNEPE